MFAILKIKLYLLHHLQPERLVIVTSSLLLLLSRKAQLPSKISFTG